MSAQRFVVGIQGPELTREERALFAAHPPFGFLLFARNLEDPIQAARLSSELRRLAEPAPLLFVDQEGGGVDRIGPLLGVAFPSAEKTSAAGLDRVHENAYLMGRAARLLGFDVDFAPVVDLGQPGAGKEVLAGRTFGFFQEDVIAAAMVFLHGLARAGVASCLKHFPGLGRGTVDSHEALPVIDAEDVDLLVNDVAPFEKLARSADGVLVAHAVYPGLGENAPASASPAVHALLRGRLGFSGVVYADDLVMRSLEGTLPERARRAAAAGSDVLLLTRGAESWEECFREVGALGEDPARAARIEALRARCTDAPRPQFTLEAWRKLREEADLFREEMQKPRPRRDDATA